MKEHHLPTKTVIKLNLTESMMWAENGTYQDEVKQLCEALYNAPVVEVRDAHGILLFSQQQKV